MFCRKCGSRMSKYQTPKLYKPARPLTSLNEAISKMVQAWVRLDNFCFRNSASESRKLLLQSFLQRFCGPTIERRGAKNIKDLLCLVTELQETDHIKVSTDDQRSLIAVLSSKQTYISTILNCSPLYIGHAVLFIFKSFTRKLMDILQEEKFQVDPL